MDDCELTMRLANAADAARLRGDLDIAALLDEAEGEIEIALDIAETVDTSEARAFVDRHSVSAHAAMLERDRARFVSDVLKAAIFTACRDRLRVCEVLDALGLNRTRVAYQHADLVMSKGKYARRRGEYRRLHNDRIQPRR